MPTFRDGGGGATLPAFVTTTYPVTATFGTAAVAPEDVSRYPAVSPVFVIAIDQAGSTAPLNAQFDVATDTAFTNIIWTQTLTGQTPGTITITCGIGLTSGNTYYWRARCGDGTSWGPYTHTRAVTIDLNSGRGFAFVYSNIGASLQPLYAGDTEYVYANIGFQITLYAGAREFAYENIGFQITLKDTGYDYVYVDVDDTQPHIPHIWFFYLPYGFAGSEVQIWGQGFGTLQADYNARVYLDPGPDFTTPDLLEGIVDWVVEVADAHAYDNTRTIVASTDPTIAPVSDPEHQIITILIDTGGIPTIDQGPQHDPIYVVHDQGTSNKPTWLFYPTVPADASPAAGEVRTGTFVRIAPTPVISALIEQRMAHTTSGGYVIVGGRPQARPLFLAGSASGASVGTGSSTSGLTPPASLTLPGVTWRWMPSAATVSTTSFTPVVGSGNSFTQVDTHNPVLNPAYPYTTKAGDQSGQALVFNGYQYLHSASPVTTSHAGTVALVAVLHPNTDGPHSTLFSSYQATPLGAGLHDFACSLDADQLILTATGGRVAQDTITQVSGRPVIVVLAWDDRTGDFFILDTTLSSYHFTWPGGGLSTTDKSLNLARPTTITTSYDETARMDLLDLAVWDYRLTPAQIQTLVNTLDGAYGVSR